LSTNSFIIRFEQGTRKQTRDNLEVVLAKFATLS
jgi:hypothetical protein